MANLKVIGVEEYSYDLMNKQTNEKEHFHGYNLHCISDLYHGSQKYSGIDHDSSCVILKFSDSQPNQVAYLGKIMEKFNVTKQVDLVGKTISGHVSKHFKDHILDELYK